VRKVSYIVQELKSRRILRKFMDIHEVPSADSVYRTLSRFDDSRFISLVTAILNSNCKWRRRHGLHTFLVDATAIMLDLNWFKKIYSNEHLERKEYKWGYSPTHGHYIRYNPTLALDSRTLHPVRSLLHSGSLHEKICTSGQAIARLPPRSVSGRITEAREIVTKS